MNDGELVSGKTIPLTGGEYAFSVIIGTGTSVFSISIDDSAFADVDDSSLSATGNGIITLPKCDFKATFTGDTTAWLSRVKRQ